MKKTLSILFFGLIALIFYSPNEIVANLTSIPSTKSSTWKFAYAKFGEEEPSRGMYDCFSMRFKNNSTYIAINLDSAIIFTAFCSGNWRGGGNNTIIFDSSTLVRELKNLRASNIFFEWAVNLLGKVSTTYCIELINKS